MREHFSGVSVWSLSHLMAFTQLDASVKLHLALHLRFAQSTGCVLHPN